MFRRLHYPKIVPCRTMPRCIEGLVFFARTSLRIKNHAIKTFQVSFGLGKSLCRVEEVGFLFWHRKVPTETSVLQFQPDVILGWPDLLSTTPEIVVFSHSRITISVLSTRNHADKKSFAARLPTGGSCFLRRNGCAEC